MLSMKQSFLTIAFFIGCLTLQCCKKENKVTSISRENISKVFQSKGKHCNTDYVH